METGQVLLPGALRTRTTAWMATPKTRKRTTSRAGGSAPRQRAPEPRLPSCTIGLRVMRTPKVMTEDMDTELVMVTDMGTDTAMDTVTRTTLILPTGMRPNGIAS